MSSSKIPARDRLITFGKYKGKMLGSLPSSYLKWVSKNLRSGDTQEWAKLADEVLVDSVYKDRMEWELAENVLNGNNVRSSASGDASVSLFLDMSERFGWDNDDKVGWSKIDFGMLGTSKGARIPRTSVEPDKESVKRGRRRARVSRPPLQTETVGGGKLDKGSGNVEEHTYRVMPEANPFPGREAIFKRVRKTFSQKF